MTTSSASIAMSSDLLWTVKQKGASLRPKQRIRVEPKQLNKFRHRVSEVILRYLSQFCRLKLHENVRDIEDKAKKGAFLCRWPQLILMVYIYCSFRLIVWLVLQYTYDYHQFRVMTFEKLDVRNKIKVFLGPKYKYEKDDYLSGNLTRIYQDLHEDREHYRSLLKWWGGPYTNSLPFVVECGLLLVLNLTFLTYIICTVLFERRKLTEMFFINLILDEPRERENCRQMISKEVECVKNSSLNYLSFNYSLMSHIENPDGIIRGNDTRQDTSSLDEFRSTGLLQQLAEQHQMTVDMLDELISRDELQPMNRSSEWLDEISMVFNTSSIVTVIYNFWSNLAMLFWVPVYYIHFKFETEPLDILILVEIWSILQIGVISTDFYLSLYLANSSDQLRLLMETTRQVNECIKVNEELQYYAANTMHHMSEQQMSELYKQLNDNLILNLMRYKVFLAQYRPVGRCFELAAIYGFNIILLLPALIRVHLPYLPGVIRAIAIYLSIALMVISDLIFIPIARFNSNAMRLYRTMWSLGAHVTDLVERSAPDGQCAYYQHTRWLILKELSHPEDLANQFATCAFGMQITFPSLVQIHYWYSIIIISGFAEVQSLRDLFGDRLDDPFGFNNYIVSK